MVVLCFLRVQTVHQVLLEMLLSGQGSTAALTYVLSPTDEVKAEQSGFICAE